MTASPPKTSKSALYLVIAVCLAPVVISYVMYYGVRPEGRTNYGELLSPQQAVQTVPTQPLVQPQAESALLEAIQAWPVDDPRRRLDMLGHLRGRWLLVKVGPSACDQTCRDQLWQMRQVRLTTGRERDRVERVWLVTDQGQPGLTTDDQGTWVLRVDPKQLASWPADQQLADHVYLIDPLGNLMMRFPAKADPVGMKKDLNKLLKASRIG